MPIWSEGRHNPEPTVGGKNGDTPRITRLSWGRLEVEGQESPFKDANLFRGGAREWDWRETGTAHEPGIQPANVEELLAHGAAVVVLSQVVGGHHPHPTQSGHGAGRS